MNVGFEWLSKQQEGCNVQGPSLQADGEGLPASLMLTVKTASGATAQGRMEAEHLGDHPAAVRELQEAVAVGASLGPLLVLDRLEVLVLHTLPPSYLLGHQNHCSTN